MFKKVADASFGFLVMTFYGIVRVIERYPWLLPVTLAVLIIFVIAIGDLTSTVNSCQ